MIGVIIPAIIAGVLLNSTVPFQSTEDKIGLVINTPNARITASELDDIYSTAASTGIKRSNVYLFWSVLEPEPGKYNWHQSDILMSLNKKHDLSVTLFFSVVNGNNLGPFPSWMGEPTLKSLQEENLIRILDAILSRYDIVDTVIISGETESHFRYNENAIPEFNKLFDNVYTEIKQKHPDVKIGNAFALHNVLNKNLEHIVDQVSTGDFVAFTYFPVNSLNDITKTPTTARADLDASFNLTQNKPLAFFEVSWSTSDFVGGSTESQSQFIENAFAFFNDHKDEIEFFTWYRLYDKPTEACKLGSGELEKESISVGGSSSLGSSEFVIQRLEHYICDAGLLEVDGKPKAGWQKFTQLVE